MRQLELFDEDPKAILDYDADDPPPKVGYSELHWTILNHMAEDCMRFMRLFGFI